MIRITPDGVEAMTASSHPSPARVVNDQLATPSRDPRVGRLLAGREPASVIEVTWARPLRISAYLDTAGEETGWDLDPATVQVIGFLHLFNRGDPLAPYPHPDTLQVVTTAVATTRQADDWTNLEGYELHSALMGVGEAVNAISVEEPLCIPYLHTLLGKRP